MTCDSRKASLIDLLAGDLSERDAVLVEQHLAECKACRVEMNALALMSHPFLSEEPWQPDAAMADRILLRAQTEGWVTSPASAPSSTQPGARSLSPAQSSLPAPLSWIIRPLPSYAAVALALLALVAGLLLGGGGGHLRGRGIPDEAGESDQPLRPVERSADRAPERLAGRQTEGDSSLRATAPSRRSRAATVAPGATKPIAFVAVYTDAMRLTTPGLRDSF